MKAPFKIIAGVLIAVGLIVAAAVVITAGRPLLGLDLGSAVILVVGGCLLWALGNAVNLLRLVRGELRRQGSAATPPWLRETPAAAPAAAAAAAAVMPEPAKAEAPEEKASEPETAPSEAAAVPAPEARAEEPPKPPPGPPHLPPQPEPVEPAGAKLAAELDESEEAAPEAAHEPLELYVVEERMFRGKPARVLSDGTIEAETAEGWMRFEDFDHLREYMDATAAIRR